jgi:hypothetical protein
LLGKDTEEGKRLIE